MIAPNATAVTKVEQDPFDWHYLVITIRTAFETIEATIHKREVSRFTEQLRAAAAVEFTPDWRDHLEEPA